MTLQLLEARQEHTFYSFLAIETDTSISKSIPPQASPAFVSTHLFLNFACLSPDSSTLLCGLEEEVLFELSGRLCRRALLLALGSSCLVACSLRCGLMIQQTPDTNSGRPPSKHKGKCAYKYAHFWGQQPTHSLCDWRSPARRWKIP